VRSKLSSGQAWRTTDNARAVKQRHHQGAGGQRCDIPCPRNQRRFHQTTPPSSMTLRGNSTSTAMNTGAHLVSGQRDLLRGLKELRFGCWPSVSSSATTSPSRQRESPFETYGKWKLAAKLLCRPRPAGRVLVWSRHRRGQRPSTRDRSTAAPRGASDPVGSAPAVACDTGRK